MINKTDQRITTLQEKTMCIKGETHVHLYKQHEITKSYSFTEMQETYLSDAPPFSTDKPTLRRRNPQIITPHYACKSFSKVSVY